MDEINLKKISVVIPCYNEENSVDEMYDRLIKTFEKLKNYEYEIIFIDDCSPDKTWEKIEGICKQDKKVKGVHNSTNFGPTRNIFQSMKMGSGDAVFMLMGDLQQPPEYLLEFVSHWEQGSQIVIGVHENTETTGIMKLGRSIYYKLMDKISGKKILPNFNSYGLYDKSLINTIASIDNIYPYLPGIIMEYAGNIKSIPIPQEKSHRGASGLNFAKRYDYAMLGMTSYTRLLMRIATFVGCLIGALALLFTIYVFFQKITNWDAYPVGIPSILIGVFFLGAIQLFFLGIMGEYILSINERTMNRPTTVVDKKINFSEEENTEK